MNRWARFRKYTLEILGLAALGSIGYGVGHASGAKGSEMIAFMIMWAAFFLLPSGFAIAVSRRLAGLSPSRQWLRWVAVTTSGVAVALVWAYLSPVLTAATPLNQAYEYICTAYGWAAGLKPLTWGAIAAVLAFAGIIYDHR